MLFAVTVTIQILWRQKDSSFVRQVAVEGASEEENVDGLLLRRVQQVVLDRSSGRTSAVHQLKWNRKFFKDNSPNLENGTNKKNSFLKFLKFTDEVKSNI